jgi:hypothetical protein
VTTKRLPRRARNARLVARGKSCTGPAKNVPTWRALIGGLRSGAADGTDFGVWRHDDRLCRRDVGSAHAANSFAHRPRRKTFRVLVASHWPPQDVITPLAVSSAAIWCRLLPSALSAPIVGRTRSVNAAALATTAALPRRLSGDRPGAHEGQPLPATDKYRHCPVHACSWECQEAGGGPRLPPRCLLDTYPHATVTNRPRRRPGAVSLKPQRHQAGGPTGINQQLGSRGKFGGRYFRRQVGE